MVAVRAGQIWRSNDKREEGREIHILSVNKNIAYCASTGKRYCNNKTAYRGAIRLDRFGSGSRGYTLKKDVKEVPTIVVREVTALELHCKYCNNKWLGKRALAKCPLCKIEFKNLIEK